MLRNVFGKRIWERRRGYLWWMIGLGGLTLLTTSFWPSLESSMEDFRRMLDSLPEGILGLFGSTDSASLLTPTGFLNSRLYASIGAIVICLFAASMGTAAIAGEEKDGTLDLLLAQPVTRTRIVLESFGAMVTLTFGLAVGIAVILLVLNPIVDTGLGFWNVAGATVGVTILGLVFGAASLALGGLGARRATVIGVTSGLVLGTWFINGLAPLISELAWMQKFTPFFWFLETQPLDAGVGVELFVLVAVIVVFIGVAVWSFDRRDVAV
jgi:ABC-2 type transport system permease protein